MNALQTFKQKGRTLRNFLAQAFNTEVKLTLAYEAVAKMEGATDWNEFSARLAGAKPAQQALEQPAQSLPAIRAILRTLDGKGIAEFDASPWFAQADENRIKALMEEKPRTAPVGYELSYGTGTCSDDVAQYCASGNKKLQSVFAYLNGLSMIGHGIGSDCYVNAHDVQDWLYARSKVEKAAEVTLVVNGVLDTELGNEPELLRKVCQAAWEHAVDDWKQTLSGGYRCEYIIQSTNIFNALSDYHIVSTGEEGYSDEVEQLVENALEDLGYHRQARYIFEGSAKMNEPFLGIVTFSSLNEGDEFILLDSRELCRKLSVHRAVTAKYPSEIRVFERDFEVQLVSKDDRKPSVPEFLRENEERHNAAYKALVAETFGAEPATVAPAYSAKGRFNMLKVVEVNLVDVLNAYDVPDECPEWGWVEAHHSFKHKDNGGEPGVWEFMVRVDKMDYVSDIPDTLKPFFETAKKEGAAWVMFHQG
jgi:hypothetical protein